MTRPVHSGGWVIAVTLIVALMLTILPVPTGLRPLRPEWAALVLIYWCMALPERVGVGIAWLVGIALDVLTGTLLGQHALGLAVVAYITVRTHQQVRVYPIRQQILAVLLLLLCYQLLGLWTMGIAGQPPQTWLYWGASFVGMLLWPWVYMSLRRLRRSFKVA